MTARPAVLLLLLLLASAACEPSAQAPRRGAASVVVEGLVLELDGEQNERLHLTAERAVLDGLPGRGRGRLEGVRAVVEGRRPRDRLVVNAETATLEGDDRVLCQRATVVGEGLRLTARSAEIGVGGRVVANGLRASFGVPGTSEEASP